MSDEGELGGHRSAPAYNTDDDLTSDPAADPISASASPAGRADQPVAQPGAHRMRTEPPEFAAEPPAPPPAPPASASAEPTVPTVPTGPTGPAAPDGESAAPRAGW